MAQKVELRKRSGSNFSGDENLILPVTHVDAVLGLLDGNKKLKIDLLPDSMLSTKRMAGTIDADTNFGNLYTSIEIFNNSNGRMYPGTYFISNGKNVISSSQDHVIYYNDDSKPAATEVELEHGDHLFYVKYGEEYTWENTEDTVNVQVGKGITDLSAPYNTLSGSSIVATEADLTSYAPTASGQYMLVTGYRWVPSDLVEYNAAVYTLSKTFTTTPTFQLTEANVNALVIPSYSLWYHGQENIVIKIDIKIDGSGVGSLYWKLVPADITFEGSPKVFESIAYIDKHIWGVVNNSYDLATTTSAGLMSASDKIKLSTLSSYVHPNYTSRSIDTAGVEVIDTFTSDSLGHVTSISKRTLPSAKTDTVGVVELATTTEGRNGTDADRALTPASGLAMLNYNQDVSYFGSLSAANGADLPDGATAIIVTGNITI